jgi:N utilization substance protein B
VSLQARRTKARERALQALYQIDVAAEGIDEALSRFWRSFEPVEREVMALAEALVRGVAAHRRAVDEAIERVSTNWRLDRMAKVDRNVLRLAVYELLETDVPVKVVINEAIELGKKFGSESTGAFVNGVLDKVASGLPAERRAKAQG